MLEHRVVVQACEREITLGPGATEFQRWPCNAERKSTEAVTLIQGHLAQECYPSSETTAASVAVHGLDGRVADGADMRALKDQLGHFVVIRIDHKRGQVQCYRSLGGACTLYWSSSGNRITLATSAAALARMAGIEPAEDPNWLSAFFSLQSSRTPGTTPFAGVHELLPGEHLSWQRGRIERTGAKLPGNTGSLPEADPQWIERFRQHLTTAVENCLPDSQNVGVMLSGGMDSGPVAALAAASPRLRDRRPTIVSWRLPGFTRCDEWPWIEQLARHLDLPVIAVDGDHHLPFSHLESNQVQDDFPVYNAFRPLILATYQAASEHSIEVVLNAAAGDALYPPPLLQLADAWSRGDWPTVVRRIGKVFGQSGLHCLHRSPELRALARRWIARPDRAAKTSPRPWLTAAAADYPPIPEEPPFDSHGIRHPRLLAQLFRPGNAGGLAHELAFARRYGLDRRDPYLDIALRRFMLDVPHKLIWRDSTTKWIAREAMRGMLPETFRTKPRTGLLQDFFHHGFEQNRPHIREYLLDLRDIWQHWIEPAWLTRQLDTDVRPETEGPRLAVAACIGYTLWKTRLAARPSPAETKDPTPP